MFCSSRSSSTPSSFTTTHADVGGRFLTCHLPEAPRTQTRHHPEPVRCTVDALRRSITASLLAGLCGIAPQSLSAGGLDLRSVMADGEQSQSGFLGVGGGLSKALPQRANYSVETNSIVEPKTLAPVVPASLPADSGPTLQAVVVTPDDEGAADATSAAKTSRPSKAKTAPSEKSKLASSKPRQKQQAERRRRVAERYEVPTAAIMANELEHAAKTGRKLAGEP